MSSTRDRQMSSLGQPPKEPSDGCLTLPTPAAGEEGTSGQTSLCLLLQLREIES